VAEEDEDNHQDWHQTVVELLVTGNKQQM